MASAFLTIDESRTLSTENDYDRIAYECCPIAETSAAQMSLASWLHGGPRTVTDNYRMLEVGCGDGANLLAMAFHQPGSRFVGLDLSRQHIHRGQSRVDRLGLKNLTLIAEDACAMSLQNIGTFDYIVAHGFFSWVSDEVRHRFLALCQSVLSPGGVIYVSYNCNPGWRVRGVVRDLLGRRAAHQPSSTLKIKVARRVLEDVMATLPEHDDPYTRLLRQEFDIAYRATDSYLLHEYLAEHNRAFCAWEVSELAEEFGLSTLGDAAFNKPGAMLDSRLTTHLYDRGLARESMEEVADFLCYRQFRQSLMTFLSDRKKLPTACEVLERVQIASSLRRQGASCESGGIDFEGDLGFEMSTHDVVLQSALQCLKALWPTSVSFRVLEKEITALLGRDLQGDELDEVARDLMELYREGQVDFRFRDRFTPQDLVTKPKASPLSVMEATLHGYATTALHRSIELDEITKAILPYLDGKHDLSMLIDQFVTARLENRSAKACGPGFSPDRHELIEKCLNVLGKLACWGLLS
jgi:SAM-dependent methyltransferase